MTITSSTIFTTTSSLILSLFCSFFFVGLTTHAFGPTTALLPARLRTAAVARRSPLTTTTTTLYGGYGIANNYRWVEEQFEIEVVVRVPAETTSRQIRFRPTPTAVDLRLVTTADDDDDDEEERVLLDGSRALRGKLCLDGTFWRIENSSSDDTNREVIVTLEKYRAPSGTNSRVGDLNEDIGTLEEFDWGGVYPHDDDEVLERAYQEPEELDVRDYAQTLGVDLDQLNMSQVDKSMFSVMKNMTKPMFDELRSKGYVKDRLTDDSDYDKGGQSVSPYGNMVDVDDVRVDSRGKVKIPLIDDEDDDDEQPHSPASSLPDTDTDTTTTTNEQPQKDETLTEPAAAAVDPIDMLTVQRLKDILRNQKLKVSGNKQELRDRLRAHVESLTKSSPTGGKNLKDIL